MDAEIFYHEDFYRQIELVPEENYFAVIKTIDELPKKENSIFGFEEMTIRPSQKIKLSERKILLNEVKKILDPISLSHSENVKTGYGQNSWRDTNTCVWIFERYGIFIKANRKYVDAIWLSNNSAFPKQNYGEHLSDALFKLSQNYSLILLDWDKEVLCRFYSQNDVRFYLHKNLGFNY